MWRSRKLRNGSASPEVALEPAVAVGTSAPASPVARATPGTALAPIEAAIRTFLAAYHPEGRGGARKLAARGNLWHEVSSLTLLQLVAFVENKFAITVRPIDFAPQNFSSVSAIARFVAARQPQPRAP